MRSLSLLPALFSVFFSLLVHAGSNAPLTPEARRWLDETLLIWLSFAPE